jgi:glycosyltransferase involved in cell wall biosynthesis
LHGAYPSKAKNIIGNVWGSACAKAHVHMSKSVFLDTAPRGALLRALMVDCPMTLHDKLSRAEVVALLCSCQCLVHASISDTWPFSVLEAVYSGTPVVISDRCGMAAMLEGTGPGLVQVAASTLTADVEDAVRAVLEGNHHAHTAETQSLFDEVAPARMEMARGQLRKVGFDL